MDRDSGMERRRAITRVELLILLVILILGLGFLTPWILQMRARSRLRICEQRQVALYFALRRYEARTGQLPSYRINCAPPGDPAFPAGWAFELLPYLALPYKGAAADYDPAGDDRLGPWAELYKKFGPAAGELDRSGLHRRYLPDLTCSVDPAPNLESGPKRSWSSYVVNAGLPDCPPLSRQGPQLPGDWPANGVFQAGDEHVVTFASIDGGDGLEHTLLLSENMDSGDWTSAAENLLGFLWVDRHRDQPADWGSPLLRFDQQVGAGQGQGGLAFARPSSRHPGGVIAVHASGRSALLDPQIDYRVYTYLLASDDENRQRPGWQTPLHETTDPQQE